MTAETDATTQGVTLTDAAVEKVKSLRPRKAATT